MKSLCIFCGSNKGKNGSYKQAAEDLAKLLVKEDIALVYGGASVGLMGILADEVLKRQGKVFGVMPKSICRKEIAHGELTELFIVDSMHARKQKMYDLSDGFIALPGGIGTLEEFFEILTWSQLGLHKKPCGILNVDGYFDHLLKFMDHMVGEKFLKEKNRNLYLTESDPKLLLQRMTSYLPEPDAKWIDKEEV